MVHDWQRCRGWELTYLFLCFVKLKYDFEFQFYEYFFEIFEEYVMHTNGTVSVRRRARDNRTFDHRLATI